MDKKTVIVLSVILSVILIIGFCSYLCINYFIESAGKMHIFIEDLQSGNKKQITHEGINLYPRFSESGYYIYFLSRPGADNRIHTSVVNVYSLNDMKIIRSFTPGIDNITLTTAILPGNKFVCYRKNSDHEDLCIYSANDNKTIQLTHDNSRKSDALVSPDGKWISFIIEDEKSSRKDVCVIPSAGGERINISHSGGMLSDVKNYTWSDDSASICYIDFLTLVVKSIDGSKIEKADLTGLTNFKSIMPDPLDTGSFILIARQSGTDLSFSIFVVSVKDNTIKRWKEGRSFWEMNYSISPDGTKIVYSDKI